ncbi:MAG: Fungal protein of unknown function [Polyangiaceae bacterium]|jgi:hypothetical protein|nr:Fungal protein of unknown function [Polyangiaceae bacterium]
MSQLNDGVSLGNEPARPRSWLARNKGLAVGLGCMSAIVMGCLLIGAFLVSLAVGLRSTDAYEQALSAAKAHPSVIAELGAPMRPGWLTMGEVRVHGSSAEARLEIPVAGPRGAGTIDAHAQKSSGKWTFSRLKVDIRGRAMPVDLLAAP